MLGIVAFLLLCCAVLLVIGIALSLVSDLQELRGRAPAAQARTPTDVEPDLASELFAAENRYLSSETQLEIFLDAVYGGDPCAGGWSHFEVNTLARSIDVFGVDPSPETRAELVRAGFADVVEHSHGQERFLRCACRAQRALGLTAVR